MPRTEVPARRGARPAAGRPDGLALDAAPSAQHVKASLLADPTLQGNRYLAGNVLATHLLDRFDIDPATGHSRDHGAPAFLRRKLGTRYLLASGI